MSLRKLWVLVTHMPADSALAAELERASRVDARAREDKKTVDFIRRRDERRARVAGGGG